MKSFSLLLLVAMCFTQNLLASSNPIASVSFVLPSSRNQLIPSDSSVEILKSKAVKLKADRAFKRLGEILDSSGIRWVYTGDSFSFLITAEEKSIDQARLLLAKAIIKESLAITLLDSSKGKIHSISPGEVISHYTAEQGAAANP